MRILYYIFYTASIILMAATVFLEFIPIYFSEINILIFSAFAAALLIAAGKIKLARLKNAGEKIKTIGKFVWILFIFYAANLIVLLFLSYGRTAANLINSDMSYEKYFREYTNFIPFGTIRATFDAFAHGNLRYALVITLGNIFAFAPMAFFIPTLFKRVNNLKRFAILMISVIISVECLQFITMTGSCDIDDFILNAFGAIISYKIFQIKQNLTI